MTTIDEFIFVLRTSVTKITYRAGIYAFFDWMYGRQRAELLPEYQTLLDKFKAELLQNNNLPLFYRSGPVYS